MCDMCSEIRGCRKGCVELLAPTSEFRKLQKSCEKIEMTAGNTTNSQFETFLTFANKTISPVFHRVGCLRVDSQETFAKIETEVSWLLVGSQDNTMIWFSSKCSLHERRSCIRQLAATCNGPVSAGLGTLLQAYALVRSLLGFKSKCRVRCISSPQIGDKEIRDIKPHYFIEIHMNFAIFPILSENDEL